jgi:hypothetical protein
LVASQNWINSFIYDLILSDWHFYLSDFLPYALQERLTLGLIAPLFPQPFDEFGDTRFKLKLSPNFQKVKDAVYNIPNSGFK